MAALLPQGATEVHLDWPGLGNAPTDPAVRGFDDLVRRVLVHMTEPVDLVGQSMGGVTASGLAIEPPARARRLVDTTSRASMRPRWRRWSRPTSVEGAGQEGFTVRFRAVS